MTTTDPLFSHAPGVVQSKLLDGLRVQLELLFELAHADASERMIELEVWNVLLEFGRILVSVLFAMQVRRATEKDTQA